jgi:hypothetical protein
VTPQEAANRAAAVLEQAEKCIPPERAQALTYVADSWTRLAEMLAQYPIAVAVKEDSPA